MLELEEDRDLGWLLMILLDYVDFTIRRNRKIAVFAKKCGKLSCYKAIKLPEKITKSKQKFKYQASPSHTVPRVIKMRQSPKKSAKS